MPTNTESKALPLVEDYLDYRSYLKDAFAWSKVHDPEFSIKRIGIELGASSSGFVSNIVAGRKNLSPVQAGRMCRCLGLERTSAQYFETLVFFSQSRTLEEKNEYFARLMTLQGARLSTLTPQQMGLFSKWYHVVVREALFFHEYRGDAARLAALIDPSVKPHEVESAIETLARLGLVRRDSDGIWKQSEPAVSTGDEVTRSQHLLQFQLATIDLARRAIAEIPAAERDISVLTMSLGQDAFRLAKHEIQHFRKRMARLAVEDKSSNRVYQLNMQFFPMTKTPGVRNAN